MSALLESNLSGESNLEYRQSTGHRSAILLIFSAILASGLTGILYPKFTGVVLVRND